MLGDMQKTLLKPVKIQGIGLHSGLKANVVLKPSPPNTGITFKRVDQDSKKNVIKAISLMYVSDIIISLPIGMGQQ